MTEFALMISSFLKAFLAGLILNIVTLGGGLLLIPFLILLILELVISYICI